MRRDYVFLPVGHPGLRLATPRLLELLRRRAGRHGVDVGQVVSGPVRFRSVELVVPCEMPKHELRALKDQLLQDLVQYFE